MQAEAEVVMGSPSFLVVRERGYGPTLDAIFGTKESFFYVFFFSAPNSAGTAMGLWR